MIPLWLRVLFGGKFPKEWGVADYQHYSNQVFVASMTLVVTCLIIVLVGAVLGLY